MAYENLGITETKAETLSLGAHVIAGCGNGCMAFVLHPVEETLKGAGYTGAIVSAAFFLYGFFMGDKDPLYSYRAEVLANWGQLFLVSLAVLSTGKILEISRRLK